MLPDFGCGIHDLVFAPNDAGTVSRSSIRCAALVAYEPRIDVLDVTAEVADGEPNLLLIRVDYRIRDTSNSMDNLVYPVLHHGGRLMPLDDLVPIIDDRTFDDLVAESAHAHPALHAGVDRFQRATRASRWSSCSPGSPTCWSIGWARCPSSTT